MTTQFAIDYLLDDCQDCPENKDGECMTQSHCFEVKQLAIKALKQEPKTGHWIMPVQDDGMSDPIYYQVRCSKCGFDLDPQTWHMELHQYGADKYCPKCGAKLVEDKPKKTLLDNVAEWDKAIEKRGYIE